VQSMRRSLWASTALLLREVPRCSIRWIADHYRLHPMDQCRIHSPQLKVKSHRENNRVAHRRPITNSCLPSVSFLLHLRYFHSTLHHFRFIHFWYLRACGEGTYFVFENNMAESVAQGTMYSAGTQILTPQPRSLRPCDWKSQAGWPKKHIHSSREQCV